MQTTEPDNDIGRSRWDGETPDPNNFGWSFRGIAIVTLTAGALAALAGLAFAGWSTHGTDILMTYARTGLAWCL